MASDDKQIWHHLASELASKGRGGDTMLAHINPEEAKLLEQFGGSGGINPETGLPEYINWGKLKSWLSKPQNLATLAAVAYGGYQLAPELFGGAAAAAPAAAAPAATEIGGSLTGQALGGATLAAGEAAPAITAETVGSLAPAAEAATAATSTPVSGPGPLTETPLPPLSPTPTPTVDLSQLGTPSPLPTSLPQIEAPVESYRSAPQPPTVSDVQGDFSTTTTEPTGTTTYPPGAEEVDLNYKSVTPPAPSQNIISKGLQTLGITSPTGGIGPNAFSAAGLGLNALSQLRAGQQQQSLQQQLQQQSELTAPAARQLMGQYQSGTIGAAQEKQITDYINNQRAQIKQRYARMGRDPNLDSAAQQEMANVDVQAAAMRDAALQNVLSSGLKAAGVSAGPAQQAILAGYNQDQSAQKTQADFLKALADMQARAGTGTQTTPSAPAQV